MGIMATLRRLVRPSATRGGSVEPDAASVADPAATVEVDPRSLRGVTLSYAPTPDGEPDPGEIVWTWVPYEEHDGRGKDRPVVIVAANLHGAHLAVMLTSKPHEGRDWLALGSGDWDPEGRRSWAVLDRAFVVRADGVRREGASLDPDRYGLLVAALRDRYGWR